MRVVPAPLGLRPVPVNVTAWELGPSVRTTALATAGKDSSNMAIRGVFIQGAQVYQTFLPSPPHSGTGPAYSPCPAVASRYTESGSVFHPVVGVVFKTTERPQSR